MPSDMPDGIRLKTGESTTVNLKGLATAGYIWSYATEGNGDCVKISRDFVLPEKLIQKGVGASADEVFTITAQKKGTVIIHFVQRRSWEKNVAPVNEKKITIIIE